MYSNAIPHPVVRPLFQVSKWVNPSQLIHIIVCYELRAREYAISYRIQFAPLSVVGEIPFINAENDLIAYFLPCGQLKQLR